MYIYIYIYIYICITDRRDRHGSLERSLDAVPPPQPLDAVFPIGLPNREILIRDS